MKRMGWILVLASLAAARIAQGGTGGGNEFEHYVNRAFDFHVAGPKDWTCVGCSPRDGDGAAVLERTLGRGPDPREPVGTSTLEWRLAPVDATTWLNIQFVSGFPASNEDELKREIARLHPAIEWQPLDRGGFVGFTSSPLGSAANAATEYYLVDRKQVIRLDWQKDGAQPQRALQLELVMRSIDRASAPLDVQSIESETPAKAVHPGEEACLRIEVDDLRGKFTAQSVTRLLFEGQPAHWSFKRIAWEADHNWFRVCLDVTNGFAANGLQVVALDIEDADSRSVRCAKTDTEPYNVLCRRDAATRNSPGKTIVPHVAMVDNPDPDLEGPEIRAVQFDPVLGTLTLDVSDRSGVAMAEAVQDHEAQGTISTIFYADQLAAHEARSLRSLTREGWNKVDSILAYDANGRATLLRAAGEKYELVPWKGVPRATTIDVISFLSAPEVQP